MKFFVLVSLFLFLSVNEISDNSTYNLAEAEAKTTKLSI